jgi:hypothetical protein
VNIFFNCEFKALLILLVALFYYGKDKSSGMEWDIYKLEKEDLLYKFCSEGPRGKIIKIIQFQHEGSLGTNVFNLAFGDFIEATGGREDKVVSNNGDQLKILHTVADAVIDFLGSAF